MDPSAAATTSNSASDADLASYFRQSVRLRDPSSAAREHQQGRYHVETLLQLQQQRRSALAPSPSREPPGQHYGAAPPLGFQARTNPMVQALQTARQFWPNPQPYYSSAQSGTQHQSGPASSSAQQQQLCTPSASQYQPLAVVTASQYQPQAVVTASQYQPQAVVTASQYQPQAIVTAASKYQPQAIVAASQYQPQAIVTASQYQTQAVVTASQYQPQAIVAASQYQQSGDAPDYGSSFHQRMKAIEAAQAQAMPLRERRCRTLEETRSALLSGAPMELHLVTFPDSAAHVVQLLLNNDAEDHERIRQSVLAGVARRVYDFIDNKEGHEVLVALLRACAGRHAEVYAIVKAAVAPSPNGRNSLLRSTKHDYWETCVKELMTAASPYPELRARLVDRLLGEGLLEKNDRGDQLLEHIFATTQHQDAAIVVQCALNKFDAMIHKSSGCKCLVECYARATGPQLRAFNDILITRAPEIAMGKFSNYFMQHVLEHGDGETRRLLVERLMADVEKLSVDPIGSYVVEACYQKAGLLPRVLVAFLGMDNACLVKLVKGKHSNYVVHKLLDTAIDRFPRETMVLARRIERMPPAVTNDDYGKKVMRVVRKILTRYSQMYC